MTFLTFLKINGLGPYGPKYLKEIKFGGIMYFGVLNSFLKKKTYFYLYLTSILAEINFWAIWDIVEIPKYFFFGITFFNNFEYEDYENQHKKSTRLIFAKIIF